MEFTKGFFTLLRRFIFGTPDHKVCYDRVETSYIRKKYYKELRKNKLLEIKLESLTT